jgi:hypothetical protein
MSKRNAFVLFAALLCGPLVAGVAWAMSSASLVLSPAEAYAINWDVIGGGGGP